MKHKSIIQNTNERVLEALKALQEPRYFEISVNYNQFNQPDFDKTESERLLEFEPFLENFEPFKNQPCVYVFEILDGNTKRIRKAYESLKAANKAALRKVDEDYFDTKCLYVGKSQKSIIHRLKVHFGYKNTTENGLQLLHWIKPLHVELKLHVYCFPTELDFLLPMYEKELNKELKPLIGYL